MQKLVKFVVAVMFAVVVMSSAKAEDILKSLSSEALVELETLQTQIRITHQAWEKAIEKQKQTKIEETQAKADDDGAAAVLKGAEEHYHYVVEAPSQIPYDQVSSSVAPKESLLQRAVREFNEAGGTVEKLNDIRADQEEDLLETGKLCDARKNLKKVRKQVGVIRARIMAEYAAEFAEPGPESTDKRMNRILSERLNAAKAEKARTAKIFATKKKTCEGADADVTKTTETLEKLKRERNEIRATEELRNGFIQLRTEVKAVQTSVDLGNADVVASVDTVAMKVDATNTLAGDISRKVDRTNQLLVEMNGQMVKLETAIKESTEALTAKLDAKSAELLVEIGKVPVETKAQGDRIAGLLEKYTKMLEEATQNKSDKGEILAKLGELKATLERHVTADSRRLVWWNRCTQTWIAFDPIS